MIPDSLAIVCLGLVRRGMNNSAAARILRIDRETHARAAKRPLRIHRLKIVRRCPGCGALISTLVCLRCDMEKKP